MKIKNMKNENKNQSCTGEKIEVEAGGYVGVKAILRDCSEQVRKPGANPIEFLYLRTNLNVYSKNKATNSLGIC
jgi:hypothetical protein